MTAFYLGKILNGAMSEGHYYIILKGYFGLCDSKEFNRF